MLDKKQEKEYFDKLYEYVKSILGYDENQALPKWFVLRLKGLATGKYLANNHIKSRANYSNFVILSTFKFCRGKIEYALSSVAFSNEKHKLNYILKIVESNLNDVYERIKAAKKNEKTLLKEENPSDYQNNFSKDDVNDTTQNKNKRYKTMW